jgi:hypothetical protein
MKFCPVVPEICRGQVHGPRKERKEENNNNNTFVIIIIIRRRNSAKTVSLQTLFGRLNYLKSLISFDKLKIIVTYANMALS